jgi:hypothetical protein
MSELIVQDKAALPAVSAETNALLSMIERVCLDPSADIDKLSKMLDMQERVLNRNAEQAFAADFAAMQSELPRIARNGKIEIKDRDSKKVIQSTPFAKLEDINDGVRPTLQKYGFGVSFSIAQAGGLVTVTAKLLHRLGHSEVTSISLPIDNTGSKNAVQGNGSTVSYGKRYAICALLNISTGDDVDGNDPEPDLGVIEQPLADIAAATSLEQLSATWTNVYKAFKSHAAYKTLEAAKNQSKARLEQNK